MEEKKIVIREKGTDLTEALPDGYEGVINADPDAAVSERSKGIKSEDRRKKILIIDDDTIMLKVVKEQLQDKYDVAVAINGRIACKYLENKQADMIFLDYEMPEEKGPEVYEKLRLIKGVDSLPVVFMTGVKDLSKIFGVMSSDPQGCIFKPIDNGVLTGTIEYFVG